MLDISDLFNRLAEKAYIIRQQNDAGLQLLEDDAKALQSLQESLSGKEDQEALTEMLSLEAELASLQSEYKKLTSKSINMKKQVHEARQAVETLKEQQHKQQSQAVHPRARYSVNVFRDMSKINWQEEHEPNELKGFVCSKRGLKTFCFNRKKQSNFFIANSLWEMGEEESEDEAVSRPGGHKTTH
ncbi:kinetochore protein spc24-like [Plakobranchus ocellatus]|uniref:Kinetochore protein Spc24 n=1 Tax=Plakobranchus ocellatus TaxID=259542 RepID=A0AAV4C7D9_9GAST|nr:kinetochore protein spc24-like [Plakobranchus ocellatus]